MSDQRIAVLKSRIASRAGKPGYKRNVQALQGELNKLTTARAAEAAKPKSPAVTPDKPAESQPLTAGDTQA